MKILTISLFMLCNAPSYALPNCPKKISVAFYEFGLLFHAGDGIDRAIVDELAKRSQCELEAITMPRAQIWLALNSGQIMMSVSAIQTPEREVFARFSTPYLRLKNMAVLPKAIADKQPDFTTFLANSALRWGVVKSYRHGTEQDALIERLRAQNRVDEAQDSEELFQWLRDGKIQGTFAQATAYNFYTRKLQFDKHVVARDWVANDRGVEARLVFSKKHFNEADIKAWDQLINDMHQDGSIERILLIYLPKYEVKRSLVLSTTADQPNKQKDTK